MRRAWLVVALCGCVRSRSGFEIHEVVVHEWFALSRQPAPVTFRAASLERAVALLDRRGLVELAAENPDFDGHALDGTGIVLDIVSSDGTQRRISLANCSEGRTCGFFRDAFYEGLIDRVPEVCMRAFSKDFDFSPRNHCGLRILQADESCLLKLDAAVE